MIREGQTKVTSCSSEPPVNIATGAWPSLGGQVAKPPDHAVPKRSGGKCISSHFVAGEVGDDGNDRRSPYISPLVHVLSCNPFQTSLNPHPLARSLSYWSTPAFLDVMHLVRLRD